MVFDLILLIVYLLNFMFLFLKNAWLRIPFKWRTEIISGLHTFVSAAIGAFIYQSFASGQLMLPTSKEALLSLGLVVLRAGWKAFAQWVATQVNAQES